MLTTRIHHFAASFPSGDVPALAAVLEEVTGQPQMQLDHVAGYYNSGLKWGLGAFVRWSEGLDDFHMPVLLKPHAMVEIKGAELDRWDFDGLRRFWSYLRSVDAKCTQIHIALDDFAKTMDFEQLRLLPTELIKPFRSVRVYVDGVAKSVTWGRAGKLGSGCQVQFYDKDGESVGRIKSHRVECRFWKQGGKSQQVWDCIFPWDESLAIFGACESEVVAACMDVIRGSIVLPEVCAWWRSYWTDRPGWRPSAPRTYIDDSEVLWKQIARASCTALYALHQRALNHGSESVFWMRLRDEMDKKSDRIRPHHRAIIGELAIPVDLPDFLPDELF